MLRCSLKFSLIHFNNEIEIYIEREKWRRNSYLLITFSFPFVYSKVFPLILSLLKSHIQIVSSCYSLSLYACFEGWGRFSKRITNSNFLFTHPPTFAIYIYIFLLIKRHKIFLFYSLVLTSNQEREKHFELNGKKMKKIKSLCKICL